MSTSHSDSYFSFEKPRSSHPGNESPLLSPGSIEPPIPSSLLSTTLGPVILSPSSTERPIKLHNLSKVLEKSKLKDSPPQPISPSQRYRQRLGFALRRFSLAPRHVQRHSDETSSSTSYQSNSYDGDTESPASSTPHRRSGISEPSPKQSPRHSPSPSPAHRQRHTPKESPTLLPMPAAQPLSFLPSEAQRVATPPASAEPRLDPFLFSPRLPRSPLSPTSKTKYTDSNIHGDEDDEMFRRKVDKSTLESLGLGAEDIPEHFPTSPLCPRNPRHKSGGLGICPYHGGGAGRN